MHWAYEAHHRTVNVYTNLATQDSVSNQVLSHMSISSAKILHETITILNHPPLNLQVARDSGVEYCARSQAFVQGTSQETRCRPFATEATTTPNSGPRRSGTRTSGSC